jgi:hypothetical protein
VAGVAKLARLAKSVTVTKVKGVTQFRLSKTSTLSVAVLGDKLVITNHPASLAAIQSGTSKLANDSTYTQAVDAAGLPSHTSGFVYVNTPVALRDALQSSAQQSHQRVNPMALAVISHLEGLLLYSNKNGGNYELTGFLGIK